MCEEDIALFKKSDMLNKPLAIEASPHPERLKSDPLSVPGG
jgi:hypothetical protein